MSGELPLLRPFMAFSASFIVINRGITILLTFEKIFEKVWLSKCKPLLDAQQNKMQGGFTENTSSINTGLLLTEFKNESKEKKTPVFVLVF
jgi:hypothetical protein